MLYAIAVQAIALLGITFVLSFLLGKEILPLKELWFVPILFAAAYLLCRLFTLSLWQLLLAGTASLPNRYDFLALVLVSAAGLLAGAAWGRLGKKPA